VWQKRAAIQAFQPEKRTAPGIGDGDNYCLVGLDKKDDHIRKTVQQAAP
jgi:hypothetical protein